MKKLKGPAEPLERLFSRARALGRTSGPLLYQLPPRWSVDLPRLTEFLRTVPKRRHHAIEFRDPSSYRDEVYALMIRYGAALCLHDMAGSATDRVAIGPFVYVRFHGPKKYNGRYEDYVLDDWAAWLAAQLRDGRPAYSCFNNDMGGHAPRDAVRLRQRIATALAEV